jgi:hypothetical protein
MWNRACPLCFAKVPRPLVLSRSEDLACPSCHAQLELSRPSRVLGAFTGLLAGSAAALMVFGRNAQGSWALGLLAAVLAYGAGSVLALYFLSDLAVRPSKRPLFHTDAK